MADNKHLTLEQRITIQTMLKERASFASIARAINKHPSTISKEVRNHLVFKTTVWGYRKFNACKHRFSCEKKHVCFSCGADKHYKFCRSCPSCNRNCSEFLEQICPDLLKPPYVCNGCSKFYDSCTLEKRFYYADRAQKEYLDLLSDARCGVSFSEDELLYLDGIISPLVRKGQSPHHICMTNRDALMVSESTVYRLIDGSLISAKNIDLPRKVRFRVRKKKPSFKVDKRCRVGRTFDDFKLFCALHPDLSVTELDSVEGRQGGKVLLTIHFTKAEMMLAFLRDYNSSRSVTATFDALYSLLGHELFSSLFYLCLADNGSEFSNPTAIEFNDQGDSRAHLFYCDPSAPYQKGSAERNHEFIRCFVPKGSSFDNLTQDDVDLMMDHINSYHRDSLGGKSPYEMFAFMYGRKVLDLLGAHLVSPQSVTLNRSIFTKEVRS